MQHSVSACGSPFARLDEVAVCDFVGIGLGPFNLSVAALANDLAELRGVFFEQKSDFSWHPGLLFRDAMMQTGWFKDLVTMVDPSNRNSFMNYLQSKGAMYDYFNADFGRVPREEFEAYMRWVAKQLPNLVFGRRVTGLERLGDGFRVALDDGRRVRCAHVVVGCGREPHLPPVAHDFPSDRVFHAVEYMMRRESLHGGSILVVGGGQTGAEVFLDLLRRASGPSINLKWYTRRSNLQPLDESPFTNEWFTPGYVDRFHGLGAEVRERTLADQKLASDGITPETLKEIYQELYRLRHFETSRRNVGVSLRPSVELFGLESVDGRIEAAFRSTTDGSIVATDADAVIFATGFETRPPALLCEILEHVEREGENPALEADYSVRWRDGRRDNRLYLVNGARHSHGIADPNLSLAAWRSARILNSILGREHFVETARVSMLDWLADDDHTSPMEATR